MGVNVMRFLVIAMAAALLLPPAIVSVQACGDAAHAAKASSIDLSAKKHKKKMAKSAAKPKKEKWNICAPRRCELTSPLFPLALAPHGPDRHHDDDDGDKLQQHA
jgi:hypothetical protein